MKRILISLIVLLAGLGAAGAQGQNKPVIFPQLGHSGCVTSIAVAPNGKVIASGGWDNTVKLWDTSSGRELRTLAGHKKMVTSLAFSPDGAVLASGGWDDTVRLWDVASGRQLRTFTGHTDPVASVAFSPDGTVLASGGWDDTVRLWDVANGTEVRTLAGHGDAVTSVAFSPTADVLASGSSDKTVKLWDIVSGRELRTLGGHTQAVTSLAFSPDGKNIASGGWDDAIVLSDVASGRELRALVGPAGKAVAGFDLKDCYVLPSPGGREQHNVIGHTGSVYSVAFSPDGKLIASGGDDRAVKLWDVASGRELRALAGHTGAVSAVAFAPRGGLLVSASDDETVKVWDVAGGRRIYTFSGYADSVNSVAFAPDGTEIASASTDDTVKLWGAASGRQLRTLAGHTGAVMAVAFAPKGEVLASGSHDNTVRLWDAAGGKEPRTLSGHTDEVTSLAFSPEGTSLASGSADRTVRLWDISSGRELRTLSGHGQAVMAVAFSPKGGMLASGSWDKTIKLWDVASGRQLRALEGLTPVDAVAFSPDGEALATGGFDGAVRLWDVASGRERRTLSGHTDYVECLAFSPDGRLLASGSDDHTVKLWDVASGRELHTLAGNTSTVTSLAFSPDGKTLATAGADGSTREWDVPTGKERAALIAFNDGALIAVTPEGFFDSSSEKAEDELNVRIGDRVFGISSFRESFYRPDLVRAALAGAPIAQYGSIDSVKLAPVVELVDVPATTGAASFEVKVRLTDGGGGFGPVRLFRNGTAILQDASAPRSGEVLTRSYAAPLFSGQNDLRVTASNADSSMWSEARASVTSSLPVKAAAHGTLHALVVGIQEFPKRADNNLTYPVADAQLVAETLRAKAAPLFEKIDIQLLTGPAQTDRDHVAAALEAMRSTVGPQDEFVFYVASHGIVADGEYYLATSNLVSADPARLKIDAISSKVLSGLLANIPASRKLVIIDTCDAGAMGEALKLTASTRGLRAQDAMTILGRTFGLTVLAATTSNQEAIEGGYQGHGLFTWVVADGLAGKAADATSGIVGSFLLADYVGDQVPLLARTVLHRDQQPTPVESGQSFAITKVR